MGVRSVPTKEGVPRGPSAKGSSDDSRRFCNRPPDPLAPQTGTPVRRTRNARLLSLCQAPSATWLAGFGCTVVVSAELLDLEASCTVQLVSLAATWEKPVIVFLGKLATASLETK